MLKHIILALVAILCLLTSHAKASNAVTNLPANTITVSATVDKKDLLVIRSDKLWFSHISGNLPTNIVVNGNAWNPNWDGDEESGTYAMKNPPRFLPMRRRLAPLSVKHEQTDKAKVKVLEFPEEFNEWFLIIELNNIESKGPARIDMTISWKDSDLVPIVLPRYTVPTTKPSPTPVGLM